jgi:hypothetical protein
MYQYLFWSTIGLIILYLLINYYRIISYWITIIFVRNYLDIQHNYMVYIVKRNGWKPCIYESQIPEENGKFYIHPYLWKHHDYPNIQYGNHGGWHLYVAYRKCKNK